jgi:hypothetical protein
MLPRNSSASVWRPKLKFAMTVPVKGRASPRSAFFVGKIPSLGNGPGAFCARKLNSQAWVTSPPSFSARAWALTH